MATVKGTKKDDVITVNTVNVIVTGTKNSTKKISKKGNNKILGAAGKDTFNIRGGKHNYICGDKGNDTITVTSKIGTGNKIYGDDLKGNVSGDDTFNIKGGNKNNFYGGKGNDTFTINGGSGNILYGGEGNDTFTINGDSGNILYGESDKDTFIFGKKGSATIKDYTAGQDTLKFSKGNVTLAELSGEDVIFKSGKASATLTGAAQKTISLQDKRGSYTVSGTEIKLGEDFKGTMNAAKFLPTVTTIDGRDAGTVNITGNDQDNVIYGGKTGGTLKGASGNDTIIVSGGSSKKFIYSGAGDDTVTVNGGKNLNIYGDADNDIISIKGGSGHVINSGTGDDVVYVEDGSVKSIVNSGGTDTIEIGKNAGNGIKVESVGEGSVGYKLVADETVNVLGGNDHDIRLYGGDDKVIVAGGSGDVVYTDGPTGSGDAGGNDIIVIQDGGTVKKIVAGNGDDVIAVANGAGDGSVIYTGLDDNTVTGTGNNTVNLLGGAGHTVYLNGNKNTVMIEAQDVTLNKHHGTVDDITVRWSEEGTGVLRVNCPSPEMGNGGKNSTLRIEGADSTDFSFEFADIQVTNGPDNSWTGKTSLIINFTGSYTREIKSVEEVAGTTETIYYQNPAPNEPNDIQYTCLPVYVNTDGRVQYNWCQGNEQFVYDDTPEVTAAEMTETMGGTPAIEIARWKTYQAFGSITFDNGTFTFDQITAAANNHSVLL